MAGNVEREYLGMPQTRATLADPEYALFCMAFVFFIHFVLTAGPVNDG